MTQWPPLLAPLPVTVTHFTAGGRLRWPLEQGASVPVPTIAPFTTPRPRPALLPLLSGCGGLVGWNLALLCVLPGQLLSAVSSTQACPHPHVDGLPVPGSHCREPTFLSVGSRSPLPLSLAFPLRVSSPVLYISRGWAQGCRSSCPVHEGRRVSPQLTEGPRMRIQHGLPAGGRVCSVQDTRGATVQSVLGKEGRGCSRQEGRTQEPQGSLHVAPECSTVCGLQNPSAYHFEPISVSPERRGVISL